MNVLDLGMFLLTFLSLLFFFFFVLFFLFFFQQSMLYQVHSYGLDPDVPEPKHFEEAYTTEHQMVRIFKVKDIDEESKKWIKEHHTYPPALDHILKMKQDFRL